jgi:hypothetical protein
VSFSAIVYTILANRKDRQKHENSKKKLKEEPKKGC